MMCSPGTERRKWLLQTFKRRVVRSALFQPPPLLFVICLLLLAGCLPLLATYVDRTSRLPDLDTMKYWNAYLGNLHSRKFCVLNSSDRDTWSERYNDCNRTFVGRADFVLLEQDSRNHSKEYSYLHFCGFGNELSTKIEDKWTHTRIDNNVTVCIEISLNDSTSCTGNTCHVTACIFISAPTTAVPASNIPIDRDLAFSTVLHQHPEKYKQLYDGCRCVSTRDRGVAGSMALSNSEHCKDIVSSVWPAEEGIYSHQGLFTVYLSKDDLVVATYRIKRSAVFFLIFGLFFAAAFVLVG